MAAAVAGAPAPNPVAGLFSADVQQAGAIVASATPAPDPGPSLAGPSTGTGGGMGGATVIAALAPAASGQALVRIDLIAASSAPAAVLLRNSVPVARFRGSSVAITVSAGDLLEIDGSAYRRPLTFQVVAADGLAAPPIGLRATTRGDIVTIGRVLLQAP